MVVAVIVPWNRRSLESVRKARGARRCVFKRQTILATLACAVILPACAPAPESALGFRLPDGDAERGLQAFKDLRCHACHTVEGLDIEFVGTGAAHVALGGDTTRVKTYGELVTSIINPSHRLAPVDRPLETKTDGESLMTLARLNDVLTVQQLIDLVAFLQAQYDVVPPEYDPYEHIYQ